MATRTQRFPDSPPPSTGPTEKDVLVGFLDYLRGCVAAKLDGVDEPQVRAPGVPSGTNLLGLVRHLTFVERFRFLGEEPGSWSATHRARKHDTVGSILGDYRDATARANEVIDGYDDLDTPAPRVAGRTQTPSMRWALAVMIQETARHAGHLDILREQLDGATGRG